MSTNSDEFHDWLEDISDPKVISWYTDLDRKCRSYLSDISKEVYPHLVSLYSIPQPVSISPSRKGLYVLWRAKDYFVERIDEEGGRDIVLNLRDIDKDAVAWSISASDSGDLLSMQYSIGGSDIGYLAVIDVRSKEFIDKLEGSFGEIVWINDNKYYYGRLYRDTKTPDGVEPPTERIFLREVGGGEELVFGEGLPSSHFISINKSDDNRTALVTVSYGWVWSKSYGGPLGDPDSWSIIYDGGDVITFPIGLKGNYYYVVTYDGEGLGRVIKVSGKDVDEVVPEDTRNPLRAAWIMQDNIITIYLRDASSFIKIIDLAGKPSSILELDPKGSIFLHSKLFDTAYMVYQSFTIPYRIYKLSPVSDSINLKLISESPELCDECELLEDWAVSKDGTKIHYFILKRRGSDMRKAVVYGYGGFGLPLTPRYIPLVLKFVIDEGTFVMANLRGGSEYGERWHRAGMREKKLKVFQDYIAVVEDVKRKYNSRVVALGRSNGGLLVAATLSIRPHLLDGAVIGYPVIDMLRFHKLYIGAAWIPEYGNPEDPQDRKFLLKYSPLHNLKRDVKYPPTMLYTGLGDDRVHPAHAFKFAAKLMEFGNKPFLRVETVSGHIGSSPENLAMEASDILSFIYKVLEML